MKKYDNLWINNPNFPSPLANGFFAQMPVLKELPEGPYIVIREEDWEYFIQRLHSFKQNAVEAKKAKNGRFWDFHEGRECAYIQVLEMLNDIFNKCTHDSDSR